MTKAKSSLLKRVLVGDVENSPLKKMMGEKPLSSLGGKPLSDNSSIWKAAAKKLGG